MQNEMEVQRAHDMLHGIVMGEVPVPFKHSDPQWQALCATLDVLCWVLGHDHNTNFVDNIRKIEKHYADLGYTLQDIQ